MPRNKQTLAFFVFLLITGVAGTTGAGGEDGNLIPAEMREFALTVDGCALGDGYRCLTSNNRDFLSRESQERLISGNFLKAWQVAWMEFQKLDALTEEQKNLKHYKIGFAESEEAFIILFQALLLPHIVEGQPSQVSTATLGRTTQFWIDKNTYEQLDHKFFK